MTTTAKNSNNKEGGDIVLTWENASKEQKDTFKSREEFEEYALFVRMRERKKKAVSCR